MAPRVVTAASAAPLRLMAVSAPLLSLNFFMADVQAGLGPFLGVFLQENGWSNAAIGTALTVGGLAGMIATAPAGAIVDATRYKRALIVVAGSMTVAASALILLSQSALVIGLSQIATGIAGAVILPGIVGLTLGIAGPRGFDRQNGLNQAFNQAGNLTGAALSGLLGWAFGFHAVVYLAAGFGAMSILSILMIPADSIDHAAARGLSDKSAEGGDQPSGWSVLVRCKPLLITAAALLIFHLGNAAMLPFYGLAAGATGRTAGEAAAFVAETIVIAQAVMIVASLVAMRLISRFGYWHVLMISFCALPLRGLIAATAPTDWGVWPVQFLDGIGAGLQSVAVPGHVARILHGTGHVNVGQGSVMTMQGVGAALSPALAGFVAQRLGYEPMFFALGALAIGSIVLWLRMPRESCC